MTAEMHQLKTWRGKFGKEYTNRNALTPAELDRMYMKNFGIKRSELNDMFIGNLDRNIRILEVGSNVGNQLLALQKMGFKNLYGIEINSYAVEYAKSRARGINIIQGSAFDIPFKDKYFDLVFTSGVLIHISPREIKRAVKEIYRCSRKYIWGYEYYADKYMAGGAYRGHKNLFWKTDFVKIYTSLFDGLKLLKEKRFKYLENENVDTMFLLRKR